MHATTYSNLPLFAMSNEIYPITLYGSNVGTWSSNNLVKNSNVVSVSNLSTSNVNLNTLQRNGSNVIGSDGKIDYTWLKNAPAYSNNDSMDIAGIVMSARKSWYSFRYW